MLWEYVYLGGNTVVIALLGMSATWPIYGSATDTLPNQSTRLLNNRTRQRAATRPHISKRDRGEATYPLPRPSGLGTLLALEPRIMFDGAALVTGAEVLQQQDPQDMTTLDQDFSAIGAEDQIPSDPLIGDIDLYAALSTVTPPLSDRKEIVFIDTNVEDYHTLLLGIDSGAEAVLLDSTRDGVDQIAEVLSERTDVDAIHIISHGNQGELRLGTGLLTQKSMEEKYANDLAIINQALTDDADFLIYGCNFGKGEIGQAAATLLAELTGTDVAASIDDTGNPQYHGNWDLEYRTGTIETQVTVNAETQEKWVGKLAVITVDTFADVINGGDGVTSLREAIIQVNAGSGGDTIMLPAGTYTLSLTGTSEDLGATGDLDIRQGVIITGAGAQTTIIDGLGSDRVLDIHGQTVTISDLTIQNGSATQGAGIQIRSGGGTVTLRDVAITGNTAGSQGGGLDTSSPLELNRVTVSGNSANVGAGLNLSSGGVTQVTNSTISGNSASSNGGGIFTRSTVTLTNSTVAFNSASNGGGINQAGGGSAILRNTILASNTGGNASSTLNSLGNNIDSDGTAGLGDPLDGMDPLLGALADNGGPTQTHSLLGGSPAINAGANLGAPTVDQRGATRDANVDIGAYEASSSIIPTIDLDLNDSSGATGNDYQFTFTEGDAPTAIADSDADLNDLDSPTFTTVTLAITGLLDGNSETLLLDGDVFALATAVAGQNTSGGNYRVVLTTGAGTATMTITKQGGGTFTEIETETLIRAIQYQHTDAATPTGGNRLIDVTVNDGTAPSAPARTTINVNPVNDPPTAVADALTVNEGSVNTLDLAINDTDADDGLDLTSITIVSGPTNGAITNINTNGTVEYTHNGSETLSDSFTYTIRDLAGATSNTVTVSLTITPQNDAPIITSNGGGTTGTATVIEGNTAVTTVNAFDAEGATLTYSITGGADAALFSIDPNTGALSFISAPNLGAPNDVGADNVYDVIVQASDGTLIDTQALAVTVTNAPVIVLPPSPSPSPSPSPPPDEGIPDEEQPVIGMNFISTSQGFSSKSTSTTTTDGPEKEDALRKPIEQNLSLLESQKSHKGNGTSMSGVFDLLIKPLSLSNVKSEVQALLGNASGFLRELDQARDSLNNVVATEKTYLASSIAATTGLSIGYVIWLLRSGVLLTALLSSVPAWQLVNPLLVLGSPSKKIRKSERTDLEDDSLESMFEEQRHSTELSGKLTSARFRTRLFPWFRRPSP